MAGPQPVISIGPIHRIGVVPHGILQAWKRDEVPPTINSGIVIAGEGGGLKPIDIWFDMLSAFSLSTGKPR